MQYSPKLKKAMEQIKTILKENDIAAFVVLHTPGHSEYLNAVSPSYSCAKIENGKLEFRLKTSEVGGKEKAAVIANGTYNMVSIMADMVGKHALMFLEAERILSEHWNTSSDPGEETSHSQQNN